MALRSPRQTNVLWLAAAPIALAYGLVAHAVAIGPGTYTTYAGRAPLVATMAGLALFGAGIVSAFGPPGRRIGALSLIAGAVWFAPVWVGWSDGPTLIRGFGELAAAFLLPVIIHLVATYSGIQLPSTVTRAFLAVVYAEAALSAVGYALFRDPLRDPDCWDNCITNVFLLHPLPGLVHAIDVLDRWFVGGAAIALVVFCWRGLRTDSSPGRRMLWPVLFGGAVVGAAVVAHSAALANASERPADQIFRSIFFVLALGLMLVAAGPLLGWSRSQVQRRAVGRIVSELGEAPEPGSLQAALARALNDPDLAVSYWVPSSSRFVDARGHAVAGPRRGSGASVTTMVRDGRTLAAISHSAPTADVMWGLGAAVRLALENERLQAEVLSQAEEIRASQARIVKTGDSERRRLERDLHDGAQQRLLAVSYHLRLARTAATANGDADSASLLERATDQVLEVLGELRELAHGIYPAILTDAGLGPALATLADSAPIAIELAVALEGRFPPAVETAAYVFISEAIHDAAARVATRAAVGVERDDERLVIRFEDDAVSPVSAMLHLADRIGALGGRVRLGPHMLRAEIPCA